MKFSIVLFSIFFLFFGNSNFNGGTHAILTGEPVQDIRHANFMVALHIWRGNLGFLCGGAIISTDKFVTAAHCLKNTTDVVVVVGSLDPCDETAIILNVEEHKGHPAFQDETYEHDIAVGFFAVPFVFEDRTIDRIRINDGSIPVEGDLEVTGYGYGRYRNQGINDLRRTTVRVLEFETCAQIYDEGEDDDHFLDGDINFCLGAVQVQDERRTRVRINHMGSGDSGGPIRATGTRVLVGIFTGNIRGKPDICTLVAPYRQFLRNPYIFDGGHTDSDEQ